MSGCRRLKVRRQQRCPPHAPWQDDAASAGLGSHVLAPAPVAVHVYVSALVVLLPPPIEYPLAHTACAVPPVLPTRVPLVVPAANVYGAQRTAVGSEFQVVTVV